MRAFIAVDIDEATRRTLARLIDAWSPLAPQLKWVAADRIHLTLKFLGDIAEADVPILSEAVDGVARAFAPFEFDVRGAGTFGRGNRVRVVWAGVNDKTGALAGLQLALEMALEPMGFLPEGRPFAPHLTLARSRTPRVLSELNTEIEAAVERTWGAVVVEELLLYESILERSGPLYQVVSRHGLGRAK